jgi:hypothetical protein
MNTGLTLVLGIIGVVAASAVTLLIPIHEVNAQVVPDLGRACPQNPNGEICGHPFRSAIPFC